MPKLRIKIKNKNFTTEPGLGGGGLDYGTYLFLINKYLN